MEQTGPEEGGLARMRELLGVAGWKENDISEFSLEPGKTGYLLGGLCFVEFASRSIGEQTDIAALALPLSYSVEQHEIFARIPFVLITDGMVHLILDVRTRRFERLYALPTRDQLLTLKTDPDALDHGFIVQRNSLLGFQREAIRESVSSLANGRSRLLLEMATGVGKTVVAAELINVMNQIIWQRTERRISALFLVDREVLEEQAIDKLSRELRGLKVNAIDHLGEGLVDVLVAQVATLHNRYNQPPFKPDYFDLIIIDEAHRSVHGESWRQILKYFDCAHVGLTATPPRFADDETIAYFGEPVYLYSYEDGVRDGVLAPCVIHRVRTNIDLHGLSYDGKLYKTEDFGLSVQIDNRDWAIVRYYAQHFYGRKCLVFAASTTHVQSLVRKFNTVFQERGDDYIADFVISGTDTAVRRQEKIELFQERDSDLRVMINLNILTAGFDYPELDLLFLCRYTRHRSLYLQMKGRGSRIPRERSGEIERNPDGRPVKDRFYIVDVVGVTRWETETLPASGTRGLLGGPTDDAELESSDYELPNEQQRPVGEVPSVDVQVTIERVEISDPFSVEAAEDAGSHELRVELIAAVADLARGQQSVLNQRSRLDELDHALDVARARVNDAVWEGFRRMVLAFRYAMPGRPITEDLLIAADPTLADDITRLSEASGVMRMSLREHLEAVLEEIPRLRYRQLIDKQFLHGLDERELVEIEALEREIDQLDSRFYAPVLAELDARIRRAGGVSDATDKSD